MKTKYNRYGVSEWVTLVIGVIIFLLQGVRYSLNHLGETALELAVLVVWILLITAPLALVNIIRKAKGLTPK